MSADNRGYGMGYGGMYGGYGRGMYGGYGGYGRGMYGGYGGYGGMCTCFAGLVANAVASRCLASPSAVNTG